MLDLQCSVNRKHNRPIDISHDPLQSNRCFLPPAKPYSQNNNNNRTINTSHDPLHSGLRFLQTLNFQSNQISVLEPDTFADLGTLSTIKLSMNPLVRIENNAFRNLANLSSLTLAYIEATEFELDYNFLTEMLRLKTLQLYARWEW